MKERFQKRSYAALIVVLFFLAVGFMAGCGDAKEVTKLSSWLEEFSQLVDNYKSAVSADKAAKAEWDAKIAAMASRWTELRNEYGESLTPQDMEKLVQKYETLMATLSEFKSSMGT